MKYNIFTDGSYTESTNRIGFGIVLPKLSAIINNEETDEIQSIGYTLDYEELPDKIVSNRNVVGELFSVMYAITLIRKYNKTCKIVVNHDYTGVANWATKQWEPNNLLTIFYTVWFLSNNKDQLITFNHTKAHTNFKGNNLADIAAKHGYNGNIKATLVRSKIEGSDKFLYKLNFIAGNGEELTCDFTY